MLTEDRFSRILAVVDSEGSVTVPDLVQRLKTSESTIRRDLSTMDKKGLLTKVYGGAISLRRPELQARNESILNRKAMYSEEKEKMARYAASLISPDDFVFLDAGTTTEMMIDFITARQAVVVTNAVGHALRLSALGVRVILLGGEVKRTTESAAGEETIAMLEKYRFTKGFFGTEGISAEDGFTVSDPQDAAVKSRALAACRHSYVLADVSKFGVVSNVCFAGIEEAKIIGTEVPEAEWARRKNLILVK